MANLHARIEALRARWEEASARNLWRARRLKAELDALEAQLPPPPNPEPKIKAIPFTEYAVVAGATFAGTLLPLAPDRPLIPRYVPPRPALNPDLSDYDVRPGPRLKGPQ